jgi:putative copper resistance protein D
LALNSHLNPSQSNELRLATRDCLDLGAKHCCKIGQAMEVLAQAVLTWIHLVAASIWVGGSIFIGIVFPPFLKTMTNCVAQRMQIMIRVGNRFNKIAIPALLTLMVTGFYSSRVLLTNPDFLFGTSYGNFLITKIFLMTALAVTYFVHVRVIRKDVEDKIMSGQMSEHQIQTLRKKIIILGQITVLLSFVILFFAALLDAGI